MFQIFAMRRGFIFRYCRVGLAPNISGGDIFPITMKKRTGFRYFRRGLVGAPDVAAGSPPL